jgi:hypothetical protein
LLPTLAALSRRGIFIQSPGTADRLKYQYTKYIQMPSVIGLPKPKHNIDLLLIASMSRPACLKPMLVAVKVKT